jgi:ubiquinol-cytochrome c reductase cytochrome b subunit
MKTALDWIDQRTGYKKLLHEVLFENVPGGARWRYVWGSTLVFCFSVQVITGLFLWLAYNPGSQTAWESVYYIQHELWSGWFLRGLHHYTAQAMTVLLVLHLMQVVIDGAYKAPREVNFWTGILLLLLVLALSLTGYLLPWDQKGYWATKVATSIAAITPVVGPAIQKVVVGGSDYGHQTLSRFFAVHAGFIPGAIIAFTAAHVWLFRKHGLTAKEPRRRADEPFWPRQVLCDAVACLAVLAVVLFFTLRFHGAPLDAPADPASSYDARPEWYFLFLFQFLKYFPGGTEVWGAIVIPGLLMAVLAAMPFVGKWRLGHRFNVAFLWTMLGGAALLTWISVREDRANPNYARAVAAAERTAERAIELARAPDGIPVTGAVTLLRNDPLTQGPKLFAQHCASCHRFGSEDGLGGTPKEAAKGSDLKGFASREWLTGLFDPAQISGPRYWGGTKHKDGDMAKFVRDDVPKLSTEGKTQLAHTIIALSAEAGLKSQRTDDARDTALIADGKKAFGAIGCADCHAFGAPDANPTGPELTGFGSRAWLTAFIADPAHPRFYGKNNDRMPAFGPSGQLSEREIGLLADWLRGEWYEAER